MTLNGEEPKRSPCNEVNYDEDLDIAEDDTELLDAADVLEEYEIDEDNAIDDGDVISEEEDNFEIEPFNDHASVTFRSHQASVYACEFHPNGRLGASGCQNEMLYVWDSLTQEILLEEKFQNSVTFIKFNHNGKYLAAADMDGNIVCWKYNNNEFNKMKTLKMDQPSWMEWHPMANALMITDKIYFCMWKVPTFETVKYFTLESCSDAVCLLPDGRNVVISYDNGSAVILDLSNFDVSVKLKHHEMNYEHGITSVDACHDNNVVALGTKNGRVMLFTTKKPRLISMLDVPLAGDNYIEAVKFGRDDLLGCLLVAFSNYLHIYDQSKLVLRHEITLSGHAIRLVCVDPLAYVATTGAVIDVCHCRTGVKLYSLQGHYDTILDISLSKNGSRLMTASDDNMVKIFDLGPLNTMLTAD